MVARKDVAHGTVSLEHTRDVREMERGKWDSEVWLSARDLLPVTQIPEDLRRDLDHIIEKLEPSLFRVLTEVPQDEKGQPTLIGLEGRGMYLDPRTIADDELDETCAVYLKGSGSVNQLQKDRRWKYASHGQKVGDLLFDNPHNREHPRVWGAETLRWGGLEVLNALSVLDSYVRLKEPASLDEIIQDGITIPIGMSYFDELSEQLRDRLKRQKELALKNNPGRTRHDDWVGNMEGHGAVGLLVPGSRRILGKNNEPNRGNHQRRLFGKLYDDVHSDFDDFTSEGRWELVGRTIYNLLQMGFLPSWASMHKQNIYDSDWAWCPIADNSDFVPTFMITKSQTQALLRVLVGNSALAPCPNIYRDESPETLVTNYAALFSGLLGEGMEEQSRTLAGLTTWHLNDVADAVARYLAESRSPENMKAVRATYRKLLEKSDPSLRDELEKKIERNLDFAPDRHGAIQLSKEGKAIYDHLQGEAFEPTQQMSARAGLTEILKGDNDTLAYARGFVIAADTRRRSSAFVEKGLAAIHHAVKNGERTAAEDIGLWLWWGAHRQGSYDILMHDRAYRSILSSDDSRTVAHALNATRYLNDFLGHTNREETISRMSSYIKERVAAKDNEELTALVSDLHDFRSGHARNDLTDEETLSLLDTAENLKKHDFLKPAVYWGLAQFYEHHPRVAGAFKGWARRSQRELLDKGTETFF